MSNWTHRGIEIKLTATAKFLAVIEGKPVVVTSLDAIKKRIDKAADDPNKFVPFKAWRLWGGDEISPVDVTGKNQSRSRGRHRTVWICQTDPIKSHHRSGEFEMDELVKRTPEADALADELVALKEKNEAARDAMEAAERAIYEKLEALQVRPE